MAATKSKGGKKHYYAHPKALVDKGADIGKDTRVWAFAHVMAGASVGVACNVGETVFVEAGAVIGDRVTIKNGVQIWDGVIVEDGVFLGPNCTLTNHRDPRAFLKLPKQEWLYKTVLQEGCSIGANATIVCGNTVGRYAFVAAGSVVTKNVADHAIVMGNPARFYAWACRCGEKLKFSKTAAKCSRCGDKYTKSAGAASIKRVAAK